MVADRAVRRGWIRRLWPSGVRARITAVAVGAVALALLVVGIALVVSLRALLTQETESGARLRAEQAARRLEAGEPVRSVVADRDDDTIVQVLDVTGRVLASSPALSDPLIAQPAAGSGRTVDPRGGDESYRVAAVEAHRSSGALTVLVGRGLGDVAESTQTVGILLAAGLPALLLVMAAVTRRAVGRALAPVEAIRAETDAISATQLHRRVPQPAGNDEIARLASTTNLMLDRLHRARERERKLVSDASHELRSPVATIRQHAEVAMAHPDRVAVPALAATVHAEALRLQHLVDDLLLLARADERASDVRRRPVDVDDIAIAEVRRLRATTEHRVNASGVSAGRVRADPAAVRRVVRNIADNAARYARGDIAFAVSERDGWVRLDVDDNGPGVAPADRARVFERFVRLDDARGRDSGGAGLGLAIVAELVAVLGGRVTLTASPLGGARVSVWLPAEPFRVGSGLDADDVDVTPVSNRDDIEEDSPWHDSPASRRGS